MQTESASRLLAKLLRELLSVERFETLDDVTEALKTRCGRLHIRWSNDAISDAYRLVSSNRPLVVSRPRRRRHVEPASTRVDDAAQLLALIERKTGRTLPRFELGR